MTKVLILTYYFPPSGGSGVQRWLKFVKYLPQFGVKPIVYTVKNPNYPIIDHSLEKEIPKGITILKQAIFEPNNFLKKKSESAGFLNPNPNFIEKTMQYIRANYFIPDARKYWIKPSVKYLKKYLEEHKIDAIITTGPPHSVHLIGLKLKKQFPKIKWLADFRDPWTDIDYFHQLPLTKKAKNKHFKLEKQVLQHADKVIVVGKTMQEKFLKLNKNTHIITNGYDDFTATEVIKLDKKFSLLHIGMLNNDRNHKTLWRVLAEIIKENNDFKNDLEIKLIGKVCPEAINDIHDFKLDNNLNHIAYIKHQEVIKHQKAAQVLLLLINNVPSAKGIITGKIFEYLHAKRPILAIAPIHGDLNEIVKNTKSGVVIDFEDVENLKKTILSLYQEFKIKNLMVHSKNIAQYHRKELTKKLIQLLKKDTKISVFTKIDEKLLKLANKLNTKLIKDRPNYPEIARDFEERRINWTDGKINKSIIIQPTFESNGVNSKIWNFTILAWYNDQTTSKKIKWINNLISRKKINVIEKDIDSLIKFSESELKKLKLEDLN